jgi:hypothetical protein
MKTTAAQRTTLIEAIALEPKLDGAGLLVVTLDEKGELLISVPGRLEWTNIGALVEACTDDADNGKARLLSIWPDCPADWQEKILAAIQVGPMLMGAK